MSSSDATTAPAPAKPPGAFAPFGYAAFALLWSATLISNVGTWMHEVGAGWLMTTLNPSPAVVTLVQAATTLPVFLFALFAGALADRIDKKRMLITINLMLVCVISVLAILVWTERVTPLLLILFTLAVGTGAAFMVPAWQAIVPQLVPRATLKPAIALNSMGINISRAIGPALAGILIASVGLAAPFALNAVSHVVIVIALLFWRPEPQAPKARTTTILGDMITGLRHVRNNGPMGATVIRAAAFFVFASAYWSLLPLIARGAEGGGSELYGTLMALIGTGAVVGALLLPRLGQRLSSNSTVYIGTGGTILALLILASFGPEPGADGRGLPGWAVLDCRPDLLQRIGANRAARLGARPRVGGIPDGVLRLDVPGVGDLGAGGAGDVAVGGSFGCGRRVAGRRPAHPAFRDRHGRAHGHAARGHLAGRPGALGGSCHGPGSDGRHRIQG